MNKPFKDHFEEFSLEEKNRPPVSGLHAAAEGVDPETVYRKACQKAGINPKERRRAWRKWAVLAACFLLAVFTGAGVFAASPAARQMLAQFLHLTQEETQYIGVSSSSGGYTMTVVSGRLCKDNAVVLVTFKKDDGTAITGNWNPDFTLARPDGGQLISQGFSGLSSELSEDKKMLVCYYTWRFPAGDPGRTVTLKVGELICGDSQVGDTPVPESISGNWEASFSLTEIPGGTVTLENPDPARTITAFYQELQINSVTLSDTLAVISVTPLKTEEITKEDRKKAMFISISPDSSAFFGLQLQLIYRDGAASAPVSFLENGDGELISLFYDPSPIKEVAEVRIGEVSIPNSASNG